MLDDITVGRGFTVFVRYITPVVPFLRITAALVIVWIVRRVASKELVAPVVAVVAIAVAVPSATSVGVRFTDWSHGIRASSPRSGRPLTFDLRQRWLIFRRADYLDFGMAKRRMSSRSMSIVRRLCPPPVRPYHLTGSSFPLRH